MRNVVFAFTEFAYDWNTYSSPAALLEKLMLMVFRHKLYSSNHGEKYIP